MKKFNQLGRSEMRNVKGGLLPGGGAGCPSECQSDADCSGSKYGNTCSKVNCPGDGTGTSPVSYYYVCAGTVGSY